MLRLRQTVFAQIRRYTDFNRPGPIPLPRAEQEEFEELQKQAQAEALTREVHPDAVDRYEEFEGDVNPVTGEIGGPKQDPLRHGDYSFNGRVTDF